MLNVLPRSDWETPPFSPARTRYQLDKLFRDADGQSNSHPASLDISRRPISRDAEPNHALLPENMSLEPITLDAWAPLTGHGSPPVELCDLPK